MKPQNYDINLCQNIHYERTLNDVLRIIYVVKGHIRAEVGEETFMESNEDILLIQPGVMFSLESAGESLCLMIDLFDKIMSEASGDRICSFICNTAIDRNRPHHEIKEILNELVYSEAIANYKTKSYIISLVYRMIDVLMENYMVSSHSFHSDAKSLNDDEKLQSILRFVNENYQNGFSLSELADEMFVSTSTLSRFFHKKTGMYFTDYANQVRLRNAVNELLYTNKSITAVAMECGFSNPSAFNKVFKAQYHMSPKEYRIQYSGKDKKTTVQTISRELIEDALPPEETVNTAFDTFAVDIRKGMPITRPWQKMINVGPISGLMYAQLQAQLKQAADELHFAYARVWSLFSKKMMISDGKTKGMYNFTMLDMVLDYILSIGMKPFIDFAPRPDLGMHTADELLYFQDDSVVFESKENWEDAFAALIGHLLFRYEKREVSTWIFEFSNTDSVTMPYYIDPSYDFFHVYKYGYRTIRRDIPEAEIGGFSNPVSNFSRSSESLAFLEKCREKDCVPDYMSFILFPYSIREDGTFAVDPARNTDLKQTETIHGFLKDVGLDHVKVYITEWNNTLSGRNFINDSRFRGTYLIRKMSEICRNVDLLGLWMLSDWSFNYYESESILVGAGGILARSGIRKPVYYALWMMNRLNNTVIEIGENYIITKGDGDYHILAYNFVWYNPAYFTKSENMTDPKEAASGYSSENPMKFDIILKNLSRNIGYVIKSRSVTHESGSILDEWEKLNFAKEMSKSDILYLDGICRPHIKMIKARSENNDLSVHISLKKHEFALYHIYPDKFYSYE